MGKEDAITAEGKVIEMVRGAFRVQLDNTHHIVHCTLAGKMRKNWIKVTLGDAVTVEMSPYDLARGRIVFRSR
jgi:translation initiation factor IF-1